MRINKIYLDRFKKSNRSYLFMIKRGAFLSFDYKTLEFDGIQTFSMFDVNKLQKEAEAVINRLVSLDFIELEVE